MQPPQLSCALSLLLSTMLVAAEPRFIAFSNSPGISEVTAISDQAGLILGRFERAEVGFLSSETYLRRDGVDLQLALPAKFTHLEAEALSEAGHVIGFVTRPPGDPEGSQRAVVWNSPHAPAVVLPIPETFNGSVAFDVSRDGSVVSGFVVGRDPPRLQPCVWIETDNQWRCELLDVIEAYNPLLVSARVAISQTGQTVAASLVTGIDADRLRRYGLFHWTRDPSGKWLRRQLADQAIHLGDVNDAGLTAGRIVEQGRRRAVVCGPGLPLQRIPLLDGREHSYATDVNALGWVVGVADDQPGPEGTSTAFIWRNDRVEALPFPADVVALTSTANVVTDGGRVGGLVVRRSSEPDQATPVESFILTLDVLGQ